ncbi:MAG: nucleotidyltransferase family protein [Oleibacter sp.]|nr:nucleotidyltransferase family protein [Thalassolituus sp.]
MKVMILAAGRGARMAPLTDSCPKPLLPIAGKPLIVHHLEKLAAAGFQDIIINHAWLGEQIEQTLGNGQQWGLRIHYSPEAQALETGGGVFQALPFLRNAQDTDEENDEPFLLVNGDVWTEWDYRHARAMRLAKDDVAALWLVPNPEHNSKGDFLLQGTRVIDLSENISDPDTLTFSGISLLRPSLWEGRTAGCYPLAPMLRQAMQNNAVSGSLLEATWVDVGTPQRLAALEQYLTSEIAH